MKADLLCRRWTGYPTAVRLVRSNRTGTWDREDPALYTSNFDLSPDGKRIAVAQRNPENSSYDIWLIDWGAKRPTRFTLIRPQPQRKRGLVTRRTGYRIFVRAQREPGYFRKKIGTAWKHPLLETPTTNGRKTGPRTDSIWPTAPTQERPRTAISMRFRCSETASPFRWRNLLRRRRAPVLVRREMAGLQLERIRHAAGLRRVFSCDRSEKAGLERGRRAGPMAG